MKPRFAKFLRLLPDVLVILGALLTICLQYVFSISVDKLITAILGLLALIATIGLLERYLILEQINTNLKILTSKERTVSLKNILTTRMPPQEFQKRLENARGAWFLGRSLINLLGTYRIVFEQLAAEGRSLRFLLVDPTSMASQYIVRSSVSEPNEEAFKENVYRALTILKSIAEQSKGDNVQIKLMNYVPSYAMYLLDVNDGDGEIQVELYLHRVPASMRFCFHLHPADQPYYKIFKSQFEDLWQTAKRWSA